MMDGSAIKEGRLAAKCTQADAARKLGVTQAYLSMLERGVRPVSAGLAARAMQLLGMQPTQLPLGKTLPSAGDGTFFPDALGALGYPGFAYLRGGSCMNPAELLLATLVCEDLDARVAEALPWLPLTFPNLDWGWLIREAKLRDCQNRLAYIVELARQIAEKKGKSSLAASLTQRVVALERSRLALEDTFCKASLTQAERRWLKTRRPPVAEHWNLLTDLKVEDLDHALR